MKRDVKVTLRMTSDEKAWLERNAQIADETLSGYIRKIALGYKIIPPKEIGIVRGEQTNVFSLEEKETK